MVDMADESLEKQVITEGLIKPTEYLAYQIDQPSKRVRKIPKATIHGSEGRYYTCIMASRNKKPYIYVRSKVALV